MHTLLERPSLQARREIAGLKEASLYLLDPHSCYSGSTAGWATVKAYANELVEMLLNE